MMSQSKFSKKVFFRADGNSEIGLGHITRCLALAEMIIEKFQCSFAVQTADPTILDQISRICSAKVLKDHNEKTFTNLLNGEEIVVLDGYHFGTDYQKTIKSKGSKLVCIDDLHSIHFVADVVINHSLKASSDQYSREPYTTIYTGSKYMLLRKEFFEASKKRRTSREFKKAFVCFGGSDQQNLSLKIGELLLKTEAISDVSILLGAAFKGELEKLNSLDPCRVKIYHNATATQLIDIMQKSDFAVVSASAIAYECAAVGLPMITGYYVDHQVEFYKALLSQPNIVGADCLYYINLDKMNSAIRDLQNSYEPDAVNFVDANQKSRYLQIFQNLSTD